MFTPIDIQNHSLKTAVRGYSKKETDDFLEQILASYEELYKENRELKDKVSSLSEGIQYYKKMETTLQKALVLAEKTSTETQEAAKNTADALVKEAQAKADSIEKEAQAKAEALKKETQAYSEITKSDANRELEATRNHVRKLVQSYENYRLQFKKLAESQIEMLDSEHFSIFVPELSELLDDAPSADEVMEAEGAVPINISRKEEFAAPAADTENVKQEEDSVDSAAAQESIGQEEDSADSVAVQDGVGQEEDSADSVAVQDGIGQEEDSAAEAEEEYSKEAAAAAESGEWTDNTPKTEDYNSINISRTVTPDAEADADSPFTFIDTE
ncbi:MAG: DivIVA domain-containing protein [Clostridiaceae bacterium]|nr:DivIVA domain-containing protein [Clostridiaceae bacterium]